MFVLESAKISSMIDQKGLKCHPSKTVCIAIDTDKYREVVKKEVAKDFIMFDNFTVGFGDSEVYLVDVLAAQGMAKSVELTINRMLARVKGAMLEAKDSRMQSIGGMAGAWDIWERAIIPCLLANCGCWAGIGANTYKSLQ